MLSETHDLGLKVQNRAVQVISNKTAHSCDLIRMLLTTIMKSFNVDTISKYLKTMI